MAKTKKTTEFNPADLAKTLTEKHQAIQSLAFKGAGSKVPNVRETRQLRRDIARALTAANAKAKLAK